MPINDINLGTGTFKDSNVYTNADLTRQREMADNGTIIGY